MRAPKKRPPAPGKIINPTKCPIPLSEQETKGTGIMLPPAKKTGPFKKGPK